MELGAHSAKSLEVPKLLQASFHGHCHPTQDMVQGRNPPRVLGSVLVANVPPERGHSLPYLSLRGRTSLKKNFALLLYQMDFNLQCKQITAEGSRDGTDLNSDRADQILAQPLTGSMTSAN